MGLRVGDWVICTESNVVGRIIKFHTPTSCEERITVVTRDGRHYRAPARTWKPYHFGRGTTTIYTDEGASLLNAHGQYAAKFAHNHGINIEKAMEHPTVKAHLQYLTFKENLLIKLK